MIYRLDPDYLGFLNTPPPLITMSNNDYTV